MQRKGLLQVTALPLALSDNRWYTLKSFKKMLKNWAWNWFSSLILVTGKKQIIYDPNLFKVIIDSFFSCQWNTLTALFFSWNFLAPLDVHTTIIPLHRILIATEHSAQGPWSGVSRVNFGISWKLCQERVWVSLSRSICHLKHCVLLGWQRYILLGTSAGTSAWCCARVHQPIFILSWRYKPCVSSFMNNSLCPSSFTLY